MPNDAKLGMIVGVGVVIAIAIVFFRKDSASNLPLTGEAAAATVSAPAPPSPGSPRGSYRPVQAKTAIHNDTPAEVLRSEQHHGMEEDETLFRTMPRTGGE